MSRTFLRSTLAFLPLLTAVIAAGCGSDNDSPSTTGDAAALADGGALADGPGADGGPSGTDTTPPTVVTTSPANASTGQATASEIIATFSESMEALSLTGASFTVMQGTTAVPGSVTLVDDTATFVPTTELALGTTYVASVSTAAKDVAGNALVAPYTWTFTTDSAARVGPAPVLLGKAGNYVMLAQSAITNVPTSAITGNLGISPAAASYITGLSLTKAGTKWTSSQVVGSIFSADNTPPTPSNLTTAISNMQAAYTDAAGRPTPGFTNLGAGAIGGLTLAPGLYKWTSSVNAASNVTLSGAKNDVWIFQITGDLSMSAAKNMVLSGGASAKNVFWQVAGAVNLGTTSHSEGIVMSKTAITLATGASINGRLLAQTAVNVGGSTVTAPAP